MESERESERERERESERVALAANTNGLHSLPYPHAKESDFYQRSSILSQKGLISEQQNVECVFKVSKETCFHANSPRFHQTRRTLLKRRLNACLKCRKSLITIRICSSEKPNILLEWPYFSSKSRLSACCKRKLDAFGQGKNCATETTGNNLSQDPNL